MEQRVSVNTQLKQKQELRINQEMIQSIQILQLNQIELMEYLNQEIVENPILEVEYNDPTESIEKNTEDYKETIDFLEELESYGYNSNHTSQISSSEDEDYSFLNFTSEEKSLIDDLKDQLMALPLSEFEYQVGIFIIESLDENGYFTENIANISKKINISVDEFEKILAIVQLLEPRGIGARNLKECLLIQVRDLNDEILNNIIENYLDDVASNRMNQLAKTLDLSVDELMDKVSLIQSLNPKPASAYFQGEMTRYITPEARIEKVDGKFKISMINEYLPKLTISKNYINILKSPTEDKLTKDYIKKKVESAEWLIQSMEERKNTIERIIEEIVKEQEDFFERGAKYLKPMSQKEMAERLGVHESTISRGIDNKFIETPYGSFELKYFFSQSIMSIGGKEITSIAIKETICDIIKTEDKKKPYSDENLRKQLLDFGYEISRRTVAKYRDELGILSSSRRKVY